MKALFSGILVLMVLQGAAQSDTAAHKRNYLPVQADCPEAVNLVVGKLTKYGPTVPPQGPGKINEIASRQRNSSTAFEREHHTAWYLLNIDLDGELTFDIIPEDSSNDYDFILYPYSDSLSCVQVHDGGLKPLRSNIRRNTLANKGITGLKMGAQNELQAQGPGDQFSRSFTVKKGERFLLVLDNVYDGGSGHTLQFHYVKEVTISGTVADEVGKPIAGASVVLSDRTGSTVSETRSNDSGQYTMKAGLVENVDYQLTLSDDQHFFATDVINTAWQKTPATFMHLRSVMPTLRKGNKYKVGNINFYGDSPELLPQSLGSVRALYMLMRKNAKLQIQIEGHVNAPHSDPKIEKYQKLSEWRARTVYEYLLDKGIAAGRMAPVGLSNREMLFPDARNEREMAANRRVEVKVLSVAGE